MDLRCTPALIIAGTLSIALLILITVYAAHHADATTVWSTGLEIATGAAWLYWATGRRREKETQEKLDREIDKFLGQMRDI